MSGIFFNAKYKALTVRESGHVDNFLDKTARSDVLRKNSAGDIMR